MFQMSKLRFIEETQTLSRLLKIQQDMKLYLNLDLLVFKALFHPLKYVLFHSIYCSAFLASSG